MTLLDLSRWWWDYFLLATPLLAGVVFLGWIIRQPARRIALAWAAALGLGIMVILCGLPGDAKLHLFSPVPSPPEWTETLEPVFGPFIQQAPRRLPTEMPDGASKEDPTLTVATQVTVIDSGLIASALLSAGSLLVGVRMLFGAVCVRRLCRHAGTPPHEVESMLRSLEPSVSPPPRLGTVDNLPVAVACGLRKPTILLPTSLLVAKETAQLRDVLAHELAHIRHRDLWLLALLRLLMLVLWAHPLYWLWRRRVRLDQELLADTAAAELTSRANYAEQLVALARLASESRIPRLATSVGLWETRSQLAKRIAVLLDEKFAVLRNCSRRWRVGSLFVLLSVAVGLSMVTLTPAQPQNDGTNRAQSEPTTIFPDSLQLDRGSITKELAERRQPNTIVGVCLDENRKPLSGADVKVYSYPGSQRTDKDTRLLATLSTNAQGEFRVANVIDIAKDFPDGLENFVYSPDTRAICVVATSAGCAPQIDNFHSFDVAQHGTQCRFLMPPAHKLVGQVRTEEGRPIAGVRLAVEPWSILTAIPGGINSAATNEEGEFVIGDLAEFDRSDAKLKFETGPKDPNEYSLVRVGGFERYDRPLWIEHPDYARKAVAIEKIPGRMDIVLQSAGKLAGKVFARDDEGQIISVKDAQLSLVRGPSESNPYPSFEIVNQRTGDAGEYAFDSLPAGKYSLMAYDTEWVTPGTPGISGIEIKRGETTAAPDLVMTRGGQVRVQLIDDATGKPLTRQGPYKGYVNADLFPHQPGIMPGNGLIEFSAEGVGMRRLAPGKYRLYVSVPVRMGEPGWEDVEYANIRSQEEMDKLPVITVSEGEIVDVVKHVAKPDVTEITGSLMHINPPADSEVSGEIKEAGDGVIFFPAPATTDSNPPGEEGVSSQKLEFVPITPPVELGTPDQAGEQSTARPPKLLYLAWLDKNATRDGWGDITLWDPQGNVLAAAKQAEFLATSGDPMSYNNEQGILPPLVMFFEIDHTIPTAVAPRAVSGDGIEIRHYIGRSRSEGAINVALLSGADPRLTRWPERLKFTVRYASRQARLIKKISSEEPQPVEIADGVSWYLDPGRAESYDPVIKRMRRDEGKTAGVLQLRTDIDHGLVEYSAHVYLKDKPQPMREAYVTIIEPQGVRHTIRVTDAFDDPEQIDRVEFWQREYADEDLDSVPLLLRLLPEQNAAQLSGDLSDRDYSAAYP